MSNAVTMKFRNLTSGGKARYEYHSGPKLLTTIYLEKEAFDGTPEEYITIEVK